MMGVRSEVNQRMTSHGEYGNHLSGVKPTEKQLNASVYSRIYKQIIMERNRIIRGAKDQSTKEEESAQRARLVSAGGKCAYQGLQIPPRQPDGA